ncbi:poly(ADP-ribose) glycohydrolase-like [Hylaeus volcanicus]|uniref:poly(ADP-ribose) glycohydrolase-like n=1 Tax=Hylaeus volcanicus TaxID=313075 RepID=UPI0023B7BAAB|nr:poly(ADP-ribose) glycohydrolase-like [Hylaeus volcanicus]
MVPKNRLTCQREFLQTLHNSLCHTDNVSRQGITCIATVLMACHSLSYQNIHFQNRNAVLMFDPDTLVQESQQSCWTQWIAENQEVSDSVHNTIILLNQWMTKKTWIFVIDLALSFLSKKLTLTNLKKQTPNTIHLSRHDLASILGLTLFGVKIFPSNDFSNFFFWYHNIMHRIFQEKLKFIASYFVYLENIKNGIDPDQSLPTCKLQHATEKTNECTTDQLDVFHYLMQERVSVTRVVGIAIDDFNVTENTTTYKHSASLNQLCTIWSQCDLPLVTFTVHYNKFIQDCQGSLQADFASHKIGGGTLRSGCAQEEIFFLTHPETIAVSFLTEPLCKNEALIIKGVNRYVAHQGYSSRLTCLGPAHWHEKQQNYIPTRFQNSLVPTTIVAVDAIHYKSREDSFNQFKRSHFMRDLQKLYSALEATITDSDLTEKRTPFASGHWGCGVFRGDIELKSIIQWLAASRSQRQLIYCITGSNKKFLSEPDIRFLSTVYPTVGSLFTAVLSILDSVSLTTTPLIWNLLKEKHVQF